MYASLGDVDVSHLCILDPLADRPLSGRNPVTYFCRGLTSLGSPFALALASNRTRPRVTQFWDGATLGGFLICVPTLAILSWINRVANCLFFWLQQVSTASGGFLILGGEEAPVSVLTPYRYISCLFLPHRRPNLRVS